MLFPIVMLICLIHVDEDYLTLTCVCINVQLILFIDNFEDIMPMNERPTTYLNEILNCRPPIFGYSKSPDSDSSDSDSSSSSSDSGSMEDYSLELADPTATFDAFDVLLVKCNTEYVLMNANSLIHLYGIQEM